MSHSSISKQTCDRIQPSRPETVESLFIAFRLTGDVRYRNYGWEIFQAIEKYCRIETGGYASILNVDDVKSRLEDKMETFLLVGLFRQFLGTSR